MEHNLIQKIKGPFVSFVFNLLIGSGYWAVENYLLTWLYETTYVCVTATIFYIVALGAFILSGGKRPIKMIEWPTLVVLSSFFLASVTKLAK